MNLAIPYVDWIWRAKGDITLDEPLSAQDAFARLDPLFQTPGTQYAIEGDTLAYAKKNPAAQDKLATFTSGTLRVEKGEHGSQLFFNVTSTALLLCFLAPLMFLGFAQLAHVINDYENRKAPTESSAASPRGAKEETKEQKKIELHPIDVMLGAPAPADPDADKDKDETKKKEPKEKIRTTPAYVLAGLFLAIFLVGRFLEPWLLKRTFRNALAQRSDEKLIAADEPETNELAVAQEGTAGSEKPPSALAPHG